MTEQPKRKPSAKGKFFDVMRPGKAPASSTSRPVITGNKPKVKDVTLTTRLVKPTPNSRSAPTRQRFTEFKPLTNIRPRSAPARESEPEPDEPNGDSLFKHVDDEPLLVMKQHSRKRKAVKTLLIILSIIILAAIILDLLLDAGTLTFNVPHTQFLKS